GAGVPNPERALNFLNKNPTAVEKVLVRNLESELGRSIRPAERAQIEAAWKHLRPEVEEHLTGKVAERLADAPGYSASFGNATSVDYRATFFAANPELRGRVIVHHAVERQVLTKFHGVATEAEIHSLENLRGIPKDINSEVHLSKIRIEWNRFYEPFRLSGTSPTKAQLLQKATEIDASFGSQFRPPLGGER